VMGTKQRTGYTTKVTAMRQTLLHISLLMITTLGPGAVNADSGRFVPLDAQGQPMATAQRERGIWPCVLDRRTGLVWEAKTRTPGLHYRHNTYRWFDPNRTRNGGLAGEPGSLRCADGTQQICDTHRLVKTVNAEGLCGAHDWRLPRREELRSLVDYLVPYPGPTLDTRAFPNAVGQFHWSADSKASEPLEAWGIGFAHGFDYAYFKTNRVHVRLVSSHYQLGRWQP